MRSAGYEIASCKVHLSYDMKRTVGILPSDSYNLRKRKLDAETSVSMGRNEWRERSMSAAEHNSRQAMKQASRAYLKDKWGAVTCKVRDLECMRPWPFCPKCPEHIPDCAAKDMSHDRLVELRNISRSAFEAQPNQPLTPAP